MLCRFVSVAAALFPSVVPVFGQGFATAEFNGSVVDQCANYGQPEFDEASPVNRGCCSWASGSGSERFQWWRPL